MGFVFNDNQGNVSLNIPDDWYENFNDVYETLTAEDCVKEKDMQVDNRYLIENEFDK
jgi:NAD+--asparagine ADP-ribosyltransferase